MWFLPIVATAIGFCSGFCLLSPRQSASAPDFTYYHHGNWLLLRILPIITTAIDFCSGFCLLSPRQLASAPDFAYYHHGNWLLLRILPIITTAIGFCSGFCLLSPRLLGFCSDSCPTGRSKMIKTIQQGLIVEATLLDRQ